MIHGNHIANQVYEALSNAVENGYDHDYDRPAKDYVLEIHDWSGINCFDHEDTDHIAEGVKAVGTWRERHPS